MKLHTRFRPFGAAFGLASALAVLNACGGGSMNTASMPVSNAPPSAPASPASAPPAVKQAQAANTPVDAAIVAADNGLGVALFQNLSAGASGNVCIAPLSVAMALQIVYNGAAGATQQGMAHTLQLGSMSVQDLNNDNAALQASLLNPDPQVTLTIANSLWLHLDQNSVPASFTQMDQDFYGATVGDLSGAPANVNAWVDTETNGLITTILPSANYAQVVAVIANVIYFKGQWSTPFDPSLTAAAPFTLGDGTQLSVPMMHQTANFSYVQGSNFQAASIPYGQGRLSMLVVMPDPSVSLSSFITGMTADSVSNWAAQLQPGHGALSLPKFTTSFGASLVNPLTGLGMQDAFCTSLQVSFPGLGKGACISDVEHKTVVEVDETGTVAAGATSVTITTTVAQVPMFNLTLDHPFVYAIRDDQSGELLFIGSMTNPS
jgi:serine protease inhibitor